MNGLPYYKRYPRDFIEGTIGLPFELKVTYSFVLDMIYMQDGKLPDDPRYIAGLLGVSVRKWNALRQGLIDHGKIAVSGGYITNYRAVSELESSRKFQDKQRENRSRPNKNNNLASPRSDHTDTDTYITLEANASKDAESVDFAKAIFENGVRFLERHGAKPAQARSIIGKWRKSSNDREIFDAFSAASREGVIDPVPWITARLRPSAPNVVDWDKIRKASGGTDD